MFDSCSTQYNVFAIHITSPEIFWLKMHCCQLWGKTKSPKRFREFRKFAWLSPIWRTNDTCKRANAEKKNWRSLILFNSNIISLDTKIHFINFPKFRSFFSSFAGESSNLVLKRLLIYISVSNLWSTRFSSKAILWVIALWFDISFIWCSCII